MPAKADVASSMQKKPGVEAEEAGGGTSNDAVVKIRSSPPHHRKVDDTKAKVVDSNSSSSEVAVSDGSISCYIDTQESLPVSVAAANSVQNSSSSSLCQQNPASSTAASSNVKPGSTRAGRRQGFPCQPQTASPRRTASERSSYVRSFAEKGRFCAQPYVPASFPGSVETYGERNAWQFQPMWAATVSPSHHHHHHQFYRQNPGHAYCQPLRADRRTMQGMLGNHEPVTHQRSYPLTANPNCLSPVTYRSQEFYYPCTWSIQQPHSPSTTVANGLKANSQEKHNNDNYHIQNSSVNTDEGNRSKDGTTAQSHTARSPRNVDTNIPLRRNSAFSNLKPGAKDREWHRHGNRCSSDSGWISDNSCSSKEDELISPTLNSLSGTLQDVLQLDRRPADSSSSLDNCQDSQASSTSSQYLSTSEENEPHGTTTTTTTPPPVKRNGAQQVRSMKPIPLRFANLLRAAAECAAERKMRLEGCPLVSHPNRCINDGYYGVQEIHHHAGSLTGAGFLQHPPDTSSSWYVPQFDQYHQIPEDYAQNQYHGGNHYSCGDFYFVQGSNICMQPNLGSQVQNTISSQGSGDYSNATQYNDVSPDAHLGNDQQHGSIDYYGLTPVVPLYVIPIDSVEPVNDSCAIYNAPTAVY